MKLGQIFVHTNLRNWPKHSLQTERKLLSAVQRVTSKGISIVSLQNEGFPTFCLCLTMGRHLGFTEKLRNSGDRRLCTNSFWGNAATALSLSSLFHVYGFALHPSWEKESGLSQLVPVVSIERLHSTYLKIPCTQVRKEKREEKKKVTDRKTTLWMRIQRL